MDFIASSYENKYFEVSSNIKVMLPFDRYKIERGGFYSHGVSLEKPHSHAPYTVYCMYEVFLGLGVWGKLFFIEALVFRQTAISQKPSCMFGPN